MSSIIFCGLFMALLQLVPLCLTRMVERGGITSLGLLAALGLIAGSRSSCCPSGPFLPSCSPAAGPQPLLVPGAVPTQVQDSAFPQIELHEVAVCPGTRHCSRSCFVCKLAVAALCPIALVTNEDVKQSGPSKG